MTQDPCTRCGGELKPVKVQEDKSGEYECAKCGQKYVIEPPFKGTFAEFHQDRLNREKKKEEK